MSAPQADRVVEELGRSKKYGRLCEATRRRVAEWAVARSTSVKDASKRARRKLHQVCGAYLEAWDPRRTERLLTELEEAGDEASQREACTKLLRLHASTRERAAVESFYDGVFSLTGRPRSVLDIGCGLNPASVSWMRLPVGCEYRAWEIDREVVGAVRRVLGALGLRGRAECRDVLCELPSGEPEVTLLLKMLPCLEQQAPGCTERLLQELPGRHLVVTFPTRSLGGRGKGMEAHYAGRMDTALEAAGVSVRPSTVIPPMSERPDGSPRTTRRSATRFTWPGELVYVIRR